MAADDSWSHQPKNSQHHLGLHYKGKRRVERLDQIKLHWATHKIPIWLWGKFLLSQINGNPVVPLFMGSSDLQPFSRTPNLLITRKVQQEALSCYPTVCLGMLLRAGRRHLVTPILHHTIQSSCKGVLGISAHKNFLSLLLRLGIHFKNFGGGRRRHICYGSGLNCSNHVPSPSHQTHRMMLQDDKVQEILGQRCLC